MKKLRVVVLSLVLVGPALAGTPFGDDEPGFIPPTSNALACAAKSQIAAAKLVTSLTLCHIRLAQAALAGMPIPDERCEQAAVGKFLGTTSAAIGRYSCPACLVQNINLTPYPENVETALDAGNGDLFCAGTTLLGDDDAGFVPPDAVAVKCEAVVGKALGKFRKCLATCHLKYAKAVMSGGTFDEDFCEDGDPTRSCRVKFNRVSDKIAPTCPPCLDSAAQDMLADAAEADVDGTNDTFYCASPSGAFVGLDR